MIRRAPFLLILLAGFAFPAQEQERLTLEDLRSLLQSGTEEADVVRLVDGAGAVDIAEADLPKLLEWGAGEKLLAAVRKKIGSRSGFSLDEVVARIARGVSEDEVLDYILDEGRPVALTAQQKLQLSRQKLSPTLLLALEGKFVYPGCSTYKDPMGMLAVQFPKGWNTYHWYTGEGVKILLSPESDVTGHNQFVTGVQVQISYLDKGHALLKPGADILEYHKASLASLIRLNRQFELEAVDQPRSRRISGRPAMEQIFRVTMMKRKCKDIMAQFVAEDIHYYVEFIAPEEQFDDLESAFRKTLKTLRPHPDQTQILRRPKPLEATDVLEQYRDAVVMIQSELGVGSGFFVREDGLILTNHHVVCLLENHGACGNPLNWKLAKQLEAVWDSKVEPKPPGETNRRVKVQIWDTVYSRSPQIDLALLKAPPERGGYRTIPVSSARSGLVMDGDPIIALGFPLSGIVFKKGSLLLTEGKVARIVPIERRFASSDRPREFDHVILDITARGGNSGGPCVDLRTGAVLCLITQAPAAPERLSVDVLEYDQSTLIDHALDQFPQIRWYPRKGRMGPLEHLELGSMLLAKGNTRSAWVELWQAEDRQDELDPSQRARLYHQLHTYFTQVNDSAQASKMLAQSIDADPAYAPALLLRAYEHAGAGRMDQAMPLIDKYISLSPDDWVPYYYQADLYRAAGQLEPALNCLKEAEAREAGYDPSFHRLRGQICYEKGDLDKGREAYRKATQIDPKDSQARLALASYHVRKNQDSAALIEYGRIAQEFPHDPAVLEGFGRFLLTQGNREKDALSQFRKAVEIVFDRGEDPTPLLLRDTANLCLHKSSPPQDRWVGFDLAQLLHQKWTSWRGWAHWLLAGFWSGMGEKYAGIASAHYWAGERHTNSTHPKEDAGLYVHRPLTPEELIALVGEVAVPALFDEVLGETNLGFEITEEVIAALSKQRGLTEWKIDAIRKRIQDDAARGGVSLAGLLNFRFLDKINVSDGVGPWGTVEIVNNGSIPLSPVRLKKTYKDKNGKVLWSGESDLALDDFVVRPRGTTSWKLRFDPWHNLAQQGLTKDNIAFYSFELLSARRATGAQTSGGAQGYLGARLRDLTAEERKKRGLKEGVGVAISEVLKDGPASLAGLKAEDVIVRFNDDLVGKSADVLQRARESRPGTRITVTYQRGKEFWTAEVAVGKDP